ncbi:MAG: A24 family peptidase C-terminal domain-containing protein [Candidatus Bathyarchaeia archaeon]
MIRTEMLYILEPIRISVCLLFLLIASIYDIKNRKVSDIIWIIFAPLGLTLTLISMFSVGWGLEILLTWILTFMITFVISIALFYLGLFGGADAKALMCLAIAMPYQPSLSRNIMINLYLKHSIDFLMPPPISTFNNAVLLATLSILPIIIRNLADYIRDKRIFEGLEHESLFIKVLAFMTGYRVDVNKLHSRKHHYLLMEEFVKRENGSVGRKLKIFSRLPPGERLFKVELPADFHGKVWVTFGLPFIVFITLGFLITVLMGDLIILLIKIVLLR